MIPKWLKVLAVVLCLMVALLHLLSDMARNTKELYAWGTVFRLERYRDEALLSDIPKAVQILHYVNEGTNTKQTPGSRLDQICSLQRTNVIREIIAYLRTKTGQDLGPIPEPWIKKYGLKESNLAEPEHPVDGRQPSRSAPIQTPVAAGSRR